VHDGTLSFAAVILHDLQDWTVPYNVDFHLYERKVSIHPFRPENMDDGQPLITLVKMQEMAARPALSPENLALEQTLSMLCSFLSIEDFVSFLKSEAFSSYAQREEMWVVFEIGLYQDHTKTLQLYPEHNQLTVADSAMTGAFEEHVWKGQPGDDFVDALSRWVGMVVPNQ
jgi:hypothetical protein